MGRSLRAVLGLKGEAEDRFSGWSRTPQQGALSPPPGTETATNVHRLIFTITGADIGFKPFASLRNQRNCK